MDTRAIIERSKRFLKLNSDLQLAEFLGIKQATLSNWKARGTLDYEIFFTKCKSAEFDWLIKGNGLADRLSAIIIELGQFLTLEDIASYFNLSVIELENFTNNFVIPENPFDFVNFLKEWPEFNYSWIISGNGCMLKEGYSHSYIKNKAYEISRKREIEIIKKGPENTDQIPFNSPSGALAVAKKRPEDCGYGIPLIPYNAIAGYGSFDFQDLPVEDYYTIEELKDADFLIRVKGDSMSPKYSGGDIVACKKVQEITFWQWHKIYAICTRSQGILIKRVEPDEGNPAFIQCVSENPSYKPFYIHEDEIVSIALVLGAVVLE